MMKDQRGFIARATSKSGKLLYRTPQFSDRESAARHAWAMAPRAKSVSTENAMGGYECHSDIRWHPKYEMTD